MKTVCLVYLASLHWDGTYLVERYSDRVYRSERARMTDIGAIESAGYEIRRKV